MVTSSDLLIKYFNQAIETTSNILDDYAVNMFCNLVQDNPELIKPAKDEILKGIKSEKAAEAIKSLEVLDACMAKCGESFQDSVCKFEFLNEFTKLVSQKYHGSQTHPDVKKKIRDFLLTWTIQYPRRTKIKEVYKIVSSSDAPQEAVSQSCSTKTRSSFMNKNDEEVFEKLLQSTNKEDIEAANILIKSRYKQEQKRIEKIQLLNKMIEEAQEHIKVLRELLQCWKKDGSLGNSSELTVMEDVYGSCEGYKKKIEKIKEENGEVSSLVKQVLEMLLNVMDEYNSAISNINSGENLNEEHGDLILSSSDAKVNHVPSHDLLSDFLEPSSNNVKDSASGVNTLIDLEEIFTSAPIKSESASSIAHITDTEILQPISTDTNISPEEKPEIKLFLYEPPADTKKASLPGIGKINEELFNEHLKSCERIGTFQKTSIKISLNELAKSKQQMPREEKRDDYKLCSDQVKNHTDSEKLLYDVPINESSQQQEVVEQVATKEKTIVTETVSQNVVSADNMERYNLVQNMNDASPKQEFKHLAEISLELEAIQPSTEPPKKIFDEGNGLCVLLHFTLNMPIANVTAIVITVTNQSFRSLNNYHCEASVSKPCKVRLLEPTSRTLPGVQPLQVPTVAIRQILLLLNPTQKPTDITFIIGYTFENDPDVIKEAIIARNIPFPISE